MCTKAVHLDKSCKLGALLWLTLFWQSLGGIFWMTLRTTHKELIPSYLTLVKKLHHYTLKPKQVNEEVEAGCRLLDPVLRRVESSGGS